MKPTKWQRLNYSDRMIATLEKRREFIQRRIAGDQLELEDIQDSIRALQTVSKNAKIKAVK